MQTEGSVVVNVVWINLDYRRQQRKPPNESLCFMSRSHHGKVNYTGHVLSIIITLTSKKSPSDYIKIAPIKLVIFLQIDKASLA